MRNIPPYVSPTSLARFEQSIESWHEYYVLKLGREPQTQAMSVGSAFDAYVKDCLAKTLLGESVFDTLFETSVEAPNRDWAREAGLYCFQQYKEVGALAYLIDMTREHVGDVRMEFEARATIGGVPIMGKPDLFFVDKNGVYIIHDWKVNGYCSQASPLPGYIRLLPGGSAHKNTVMRKHSGVAVAELPTRWWDQLSIYAWSQGCEVGSEFVGSVDQLACNSSASARIRVAAFRGLIPAEHQRKLLERLQYMWDVVNSEHLFRDLALEASKKKEEGLEYLIDFR